VLEQHTYNAHLEQHTYKAHLEQHTYNAHLEQHTYNAHIEQHTYNAHHTYLFTAEAKVWWNVLFVFGHKFSSILQVG